ncbi:MAG: Eco57I restriction-modification methylase domain-containing protein, partial [Candidatus Omnitrophica bacterium]|nr:Eco57I restriction-modification methylase domain-containing protein [Candidatus Omnitrophota bacterium]
DALALDRSHIDHWNDHFQCKIPFLNGGLFDPINNYSWEKTVIDLPNDLFSNDRKDIKTGDIGNGILDIFDRYNFTVKEDEPLEKEVAVDPEMLGKVFENLLEVKDRKSKGTYYTPREIVHYMCQQSLINYLSTELEGKITKEDIETLIKYGEQVGENEATVEAKGRETDTYSYKLSESIRQNAELVDEKLASIKVCDPAIGSGAFPVGMMTEIVRARKTLSSYIKDSGRTLYNFKRDCIHNSLYGVDIDPSAVEIAKLRLWLSLVVDEDDIRQIKPLPNLDYKIMQGNSLLDEYGGVRLFDDKLISTVNFDKEKQISNLKEKQAELSSEYIRLHQADKLTRDKKQQIDEELKKINSQIKRLEQSGKKVEENASLFDIYSSAKKKSDELKRLHKEFFETTQKTKKDELKKQIERLEWDLIETTLREQNKSSELKKIEVLKKANIKPFFLWKLHFSDVFQENGGFDIVIANPPYNAELSDQERELYKNKFECVRTGRQDTAAIFVEVAKRIGNPDMQFSFILPFRLFSRKRNHGEFQIYTLNNFSILSILYLGSNVGFSANDEFMILVMSSRINYKNKINVAFKPALEELWDSRIFTKIDQSLLIEKREVNLNIARFDVDLLGKINNGCLSLETICHVKDGIVPFIREKLVKDKKADSRYVKFAGIAGRYHLSKYYFSCDDLWLCYDIKEAMRFIKDKVELRKVQLREREIFLHRKILTAQNSAILKGSIDENKIFVSNSLHSTYLRDEYENLFYLEYILALINSPAINYYHNSLRQKGTDLHPQILVSDLKKLPIKNISTQDQAPFKNLAEQILEITTTSKDYLQSSAKQAQVKEYEHQIDQMVYELYGLTKEEIKIVEGA